MIDNVENYLSASLINQFSKVQPKFIKKKYDYITALTGYEGDGKSTLGLELCCFVDPTFSLERIVFNPEQFKKEYDSIKRGQALLVDEAIDVFGAKSQMRKEQYANLKALVKGRSKCAFVTLCSPSLFLLEWYVAQNRIRLLGSIPKFQRGKVVFYNLDKQSIKFVRASHKLVYPSRPAFIGTNKQIPEDNPSWLAYERKKTINQRIETAVDKEIKKMIKKRNKWRLKYYKTREVCKILSVSIDTVERRVKQKLIKKYYDEFGGVWYTKKGIQRLLVNQSKMSTKKRKN